MANIPRVPWILFPFQHPQNLVGKLKKRAKEIQDLYARVRDNITKANERAMQNANKHRKEVHFQPGDLV